LLDECFNAIPYNFVIVNNEYVHEKMLIIS